MWPFKQIKRWLQDKRENKQPAPASSTSFFSSPTKWFQERKDRKDEKIANEHLDTINNIIGRDEQFIMQNQDKLERAINYFKTNPNILEKLGYSASLKDFIKPMDKEGIATHVAKNIPSNLINKELYKKYVSLPETLKLLDELKRITSDLEREDMWGLNSVLNELAKYTQELKEEMGLNELARLVANHAPDTLYSDIEPIKKEIGPVANRK